MAELCSCWVLSVSCDGEVCQRTPQRIRVGHRLVVTYLEWRCAAFLNTSFATVDVLAAAQWQLTSLVECPGMRILGGMHAGGCRCVPEFDGEQESTLGET